MYLSNILLLVPMISILENQLPLYYLSITSYHWLNKLYISIQLPYLPYINTTLEPVTIDFYNPFLQYPVTLLTLLLP